MGYNVAVFIVTCGGMPVLRKTIESMHSKADYDYDFYVLLNGSTDGSEFYLNHYSPKKAHVVVEPENKGLPISYNKILSVIKAKGNYDFVVFVEDDCCFETDGWLKSLVEAYEYLDGMALLCPFRIGYMWPANIGQVHVKNNYIDETKTNTTCYADIKKSPPTTCMLAPMKFFDDFSFDERKPMHSGDLDIGTYCNENDIDMYYVLNVVVRHLEDARPRPKQEFDRFIKCHVPYGI